VINYTTEDFESRVKEITGGRGVDVVYDGVGKATFAGSLEALCTRGLMVSYGQASGKIDPFDVGILAAKGSLYLTRPTLFTYIQSRPALLEMAADVFDAVEKGILHPEVGRRYALADAAEAHADLESRRIVGTALLIP
jgi:NADPH2:quinone reductase